MRQQYIKNVVTLKYTPERCVGCGRCAEVCPHAVFAVVNGNNAVGNGNNAVGKSKAAIQNLDSCMECGACALNCPANAISVHAGVGCAAAIIKGLLTGQEATCC